MSDPTRKQSFLATPVRSIRVSVVQGPDRGAEVVAGEHPIGLGSAETNDLVLHDPSVSRLHLELRRRGGEIVVRDHGSTNGTRVGHVLLRDVEATLAPGAVLALGDTRVSVDDGARYVLQGAGPDTFGALLGRSAALRSATSILARVAPSDVSLLLEGESGTGKELAARAVHDASPRAAAPFVTVDCAALAPTLFASELFGHEKGAFTGADRRHAGAFERADRGTLFLDEIGELGPELQGALLGALERKRVRRVGGSQEVDVDVRVIAATHRDLRGAVNAGSFRLDLYYRLAGVRVAMPALRERPEDIPLLVRQFLDRAGHGAEIAALFDAGTMAALQRHDWPGNVRELYNVVRGAAVLGTAPELVRTPRPPAGDPIESVLDLEYVPAKRALLDVFERRWLERLVERTRGNVRAASREGRIERKHLIDLLGRHGIRS